MSKAAAPSRGEKLTIQWGLLTIPITLFNAVDESAGKITRHKRTLGGNPVGNQNVDKVTGEIVGESDVVLAMETDNGEVPLTDDEVSAAMGVAKGDTELLGVYPVTEAEKYLTAGNYVVTSQGVGVGKKKTYPYARAFQLFLTALSTTDTFALITYVGRGKPKLLGIFADGTARLFHWANEVRESMPETELSEPIKSVEVKQALLLLQTVMAEKAPELENEPFEKVRAYATAKAAGEALPTPEAPEVTDVTVDLALLLEQSVKAAQEAKA